ncbi:MAG TPA: VanZ family protein [Gemmatimonadales bacterium]|jgi:hypothetical protein
MPATLRHRWFLAAAVTAILTATLFPISGGDPEPWLGCVLCGERGIADALINILLFLPLGAVLAAAGMSWARCFLVGALLSAGVEFAQLYIPGRDPSLGDVLFNTLGAGLGAALVPRAWSWLLPAGKQAARLCRAAAFGAAALCYVTGWLLAPALPRGDYATVWAPHFVHLAWYPGRVRDARIGDVGVPEGPIAGSAAVRDLLRSPKGFALHVAAIAGSRPGGLGGLLAVYDERSREVLLVGPDRDDLVFRLRTRATAWHLDQPDVRLPHALRSVAPGDLLDVTVYEVRGRYAMRVGSSDDAGLGPTVGSGWGMLMYPESLPAWLKTVLSVAWVAAMWLPAGLWARARGDGAMIGAAAAAGLLGAPTVLPLCPTPLLQWAAAGLGVFGGTATAVILRRRANSPAVPATSV